MDVIDAGARLTTLFEEHYDEVLAYCTRRIGRDAADDVASEVFAVALRRIDEVEWKSVQPWLDGIARYLLISRWRSRRRRSRLRDRLAGLVPPLGDSPDVRLVRTEDDQAVIDCLMRLKAPDREVVMLAAWEGLTSSEVGIVLGISTPAAEWRLRRARSRFGREFNAGRSHTGISSVRNGKGTLVSDDHAFGRLRDSNPVPRPGALLGDSHELPGRRVAAVKRSTDIPLPETTKPIGRPPRMRGWLAAGATAVVVVVVGLATDIEPSAPGQNPTSTLPATEQAALDAANAFFDALDDQDPTTARELLTPELAEDPIIANGIDFLAALGPRWYLSDCHTSSTDEGGSAACLLTIDHPLFEATGETRAEALVLVDHGGLIRMRPELGVRGGVDVAIQTFGRQTDPEAFDRTCSVNSVTDPGTVRTSPGYQWTGACGELIARHTGDIVALAEGSAAVVATRSLYAALTRGDPDSARELLGPDLMDDPVIANQFEFLAALGANWSVSDCQASTTSYGQDGGGLRGATCLLTVDHPLFHAAGDTEAPTTVHLDEEGLIGTRPSLGSRPGFHAAVRNYGPGIDPDGFDRVCAPGSVEEPGAVSTITGIQWTGACGELIARLSAEIVARMEAVEPSG